MQCKICCVPVSPVRAEPSHRSEMVSQLLFGEVCTLLETKEDYWGKIKMAYDGYEGWVTLSHLQMIEESQLQTEMRLTLDYITEISYRGIPMMLPMGCTINHWENAHPDCAIAFSGKAWSPIQSEINEELIKKIASKYLNTTYLWGGRTVFGIDCSGFAQMVFKYLNIPLLRDASMQAQQGEVVDFLQSAKCGDLAFFDNEEGRITHVGILLNDKEIIHSAGKVRIDKIDLQGIINTDTNKRTHKLRIIKRMF